MKPQDQEFIHQPEKGIYGDCQRAVLASLLEMDMCQVPHFCAIAEDNSDVFWEEVQKFLNPLGYAYLTVPATQAHLWGLNTDLYHDISGPSPRDPTILHAVVGLGGKIVHDPHPTRAGLSGDPREWTYGFLVRFDPGNKNTASGPWHIDFPWRFRYKGKQGLPKVKIYITNNLDEKRTSGLWFYVASNDRCSNSRAEEVAFINECVSQLSEICRPQVPFSALSLSALTQEQRDRAYTNGLNTVRLERLQGTTRPFVSGNFSTCGFELLDVCDALMTIRSGILAVKKLPIQDQHSPSTRTAMRFLQHSLSDSAFFLKANHSYVNLSVEFDDHASSVRLHMAPRCQQTEHLATFFVQNRVLQVRLAPRFEKALYSIFDIPELFMWLNSDD